ncbi:MAG TPA: RecX family transcriptional regulator [Candidatus Binatia bacterium]|jgi:SOS response regulatory protein OraA/RecX
MPPAGQAHATSAIEFAIALVAARSRTEKNLHEKIRARYGAEETEAALARLRELGLVDDAAWAERFARDRFERAGQGRHRIRAALVVRGIDAAIADAAIQRAVGADDERLRALRVLDALRARVGAAEAGAKAKRGDAQASPGAAGGVSTRPRRGADSLKNRLFRRMIARGYPASLVRDLLDVS